MVRTRTALLVLLLSFLLFFSIGALLLGRYYLNGRRVSPQNSTFVSAVSEVLRR